MNIEKIKEQLGGVIYHCTQENFEKGYDPIGDILADLEIDNLNEDDTLLSTTFQYYKQK
jgi:hypothetical protein